MKFFPATILFFFLSIHLSAQRISRDDYKRLQKGEDSAIAPLIKLSTNERLADRFHGDSIFTRIFVRTLKAKNSFYYPFDSLESISKLYAPDSSFRIFTWQMIVNENLIRQHGAIQMRTPDGSLKLFPLIDKSDVTEHMEDSVANNYGWMGAVYYKIVLTKYLNHNYYTLLGFDGNTIRSDRKMIEVLSFVNNEPVFGGHYFSVPNDKLISKNPARYIMEFKKDAGPRLNYDEQLQVIVMEHLVSEGGEPNKKFTLVGDGDYEGFKWANGKWVYISKLFNEVTPEGNVPVPKPLDVNHGVIKEEDDAVKPKQGVKKKG